MTPVYLAIFETPLETIINNIYNFIKDLFSDGGPLAYLEKGIKFLFSLPELFADMPAAVLAILGFGALGVVIGVILRIG